MAIATLVLASALWGTALTGTKYALGGFDAFTLLLVELTFATAGLWMLVLVRGLRRPSRPSSQSRPGKLALVLGLLEPGLANLGQTFGLDRTSAADGSVVAGLESAFVVVLAAVFLRERLTGGTAAAVCLAFTGLLILQGGNPLAGSGSGDLFVALGVLSASSYTIVIKRFGGPQEDALALTAYQFSAATALALVVVVSRWMAGATALPTALPTGLSAVPARFWVVAALVGIGGSAVSFVLFNRTISRVSAGAATIVLNAIPLFGVGTAVTLLGETLRLESLLGAACIAVAVGGFVLAERRAAKVIVIPAPRPEPVGLQLRAGPARLPR